MFKGYILKYTDILVSFLADYFYKGMGTTTFSVQPFLVSLEQQQTLMHKQLKMHTHSFSMSSPNHFSKLSMWEHSLNAKFHKDKMYIVSSNYLQS